MKTTKVALASALLLSLGLGTAMAQEISTVTIVPSAKGENAVTVISDLEKDFNEVKPIENGLVFLNRLPTRWKITQEQIEEYGRNSDAQFIEVVTKSDKETQTAVYDLAGNLVDLKDVIINVPLPKTATQIINRKYNDWKVLSNVEVVNTASRKTDYIKVKMEEGAKKKALFFDVEGNELNNRLNPIAK